MSRGKVDLLLQEMDSAWEGFVGSLDALTDDEYHWRPTADAYTLRHVVPPDSEDWPGDPADAPAPLSTIELKVAHVATCKIMYAEHAFREGRLRWRLADLRVPGTLGAMRAYCAEAHQVLRELVDGLSDADLPMLRKTNGRLVADRKDRVDDDRPRCLPRRADSDNAGGVPGRRGAGDQPMTPPPRAVSS